MKINKPHSKTQSINKTVLKILIYLRTPILTTLILANLINSMKIIRDNDIMTEKDYIKKVLKIDETGKKIIRFRNGKYQPFKLINQFVSAYPCSDYMAVFQKCYANGQR